MPKGTNKIRFRPRSVVPTDKKVTYCLIVATLRPQNEEQHRIRLTVGGDKLDYFGDASTLTTDLTIRKLHLNSIISTPDAKFVTADIKHFYYNNDLSESEWMRLPITIIPAEIIQQYNLHTLTTDGWINIEILKRMYGLKQAGIIVYDELVKHLAKSGYTPIKNTPEYWKHTTKNFFCIMCR